MKTMPGGTPYRETSTALLLIDVLKHFSFPDPPKILRHAEPGACNLVRLTIERGPQLCAITGSRWLATAAAPTEGQYRPAIDHIRPRSEAGVPASTAHALGRSAGKAM